MNYRMLYHFSYDVNSSYITVPETDAASYIDSQEWFYTPHEAKNAKVKTQKNEIPNCKLEENIEKPKRQRKTKKENICS